MDAISTKVLDKIIKLFKLKSKEKEENKNKKYACSYGLVLQFSVMKNQSIISCYFASNKLGANHNHLDVHTHPITSISYSCISSRYLFLRVTLLTSMPFHLLLLRSMHITVKKNDIKPAVMSYSSLLVHASGVESSCSYTCALCIYYPC